MVLWDLQRLRILRELAERRTLTAVADALGYSPSAISQQMAVLEREAGTALMQQAGRDDVPDRPDRIELRRRGAVDSDRRM